MTEAMQTRHYAKPGKLPLRREYFLDRRTRPRQAGPEVDPRDAQTTTGLDEGVARIEDLNSGGVDQTEGFNRAITTDRQM